MDVLVTEIPYDYRDEYCHIDILTILLKTQQHSYIL